MRTWSSSTASAKEATIHDSPDWSHPATSPTCSSPLARRDQRKASSIHTGTFFTFDFARGGPVELGRLLQRERLTMYHSVPSIFRSFLTETSHFPDMRVI